MGKQMQFELWMECNSRCVFCYNEGNYDHTPDECKLNALQKTIDKISDLNNYPEYDTLAYLGGEFFQGQMRNPLVKEKFLELMNKTKELYDKGYIKNIWIYATMTIGDQKDLYDTLNVFGNNKDLWILTSYDTIGRFHTPKMEETWDYNMRHIHELYPDIKFNITSILSGDLIDKYLADKISFKDMMEKYHTTFFFKQCGCSEFGGENAKQEMNAKLPNFFPTRDKFLKFLMKFRRNESNEMWDKLFNIKYRADDLYRNYNEIEHQMQLCKRCKTSVVESNKACDQHFNSCGHMVSYAAYIDCDGCVVCDRDMIKQMLG